ncbi:hypothetical protein CCMA1212_005446 [Trichoderma ghanense]|uniref:SSCRP protein n=1 Tax=Trichoderma ghanense TaxID=65468 RepID=A0ABY2H3P8_9HYPO
MFAKGCAMRAILFVLFAIAAGEALPPDAVPVMCAAICGPIVELSSMCSPKRSLGESDDHQLELRAHARHARRHNAKPVEEDEKRVKRFSVIVPAPTTFPPDLVDASYMYVPASSSASWQVSAAPAQNYAPPTQPQSTPAAAPASPTTPGTLLPTPSLGALPSTTPSSSVQPPTLRTEKEKTASPTSTSTHPASSMPAKADGSMTGGREEIENAEERCVCLNTSFDVAEIAGLCASCIGMVANTQNNMEVIMSVCGFPPQQYSPDKDRLASNIWVKATRPTAGTKANGASRSTRLAGIGVIVGVSFTIGALMML